VRTARLRRRRGFSLIEALIVLLVAGMALMLVFSIGGDSARTGFQLGRRALAAADGEVAEDELRGLIAALELAPARRDPAKVKLAPFAGDARGFTADAVLARPGPCGPAGPAGRLRVAIERYGDGDEVICQAGAAAPVMVADLRPRHARFAYSLDGAHWSDGYASPTSFDPKADPAEQALFIRLASDDGLVDIVGRASSGPPWLYPAPTPPKPAGPL
jgi:prepilin-type N-terminal cleavage/methylation domain-containing protein